MNCQLLDIRPAAYRFTGAHTALVRDRLGTPEERSDDYDERYDFTTFFYDVFFDRDRREIRMVCPSLLNFKAVLSECAFKADGADLAIKSVIKSFRGNTVVFDAPSGNPKYLHCAHPLFSVNVPISRAFFDFFNGANLIFSISKNNKLPWLRDWLHYHVAEHGADAVILVDNGSTDYSAHQLGDAIRSVDGITRAALVHADFPFGPRGLGNANFDALFLHMTMLDLARQRLLRDARAVLSVDIDELVRGVSGESIFDATVASSEGYLRFNGEWVYAEPTVDDRVTRHADHGFTRADGRPRASRKWCVVPDGPQRGEIWRTHRILPRKTPCTPDFKFWHFRQVSNGWHYDRADWQAEDMKAEPDLQQTMHRVFSKTEQ